jgi:hypothetical protein
MPMDSIDLSVAPTISFRLLYGLLILSQVGVYMLRVEKQLKTWREKGQRQMRWFTLEEAADLVQEPGLIALLRDLARTDFGGRRSN